jgi:two-component system, LuxR family, sensor kinase FixL
VNLNQNAIDAVCEAGSERKQIHVQTRRTEDAMAEVTVPNIGTVFSDATAARLFEASSTTKAQGLGMGPAISRSIIEAHYGRIWMALRAGDARGTTVRFAAASGKAFPQETLMTASSTAAWSLPR